MEHSDRTLIRTGDTTAVLYALVDKYTPCELRSRAREKLDEFCVLLVHCPLASNEYTNPRSHEVETRLLLDIHPDELLRAKNENTGCKRPEALK